MSTQKRFYHHANIHLATADSLSGRVYRALKRPRRASWGALPIEGLVVIQGSIPADMDIINTHLAGIHLKLGEVYEVPVLIRMTGNGGTPGAGRALAEPEELLLRTGGDEEHNKYDD